MHLLSVKWHIQINLKPRLQVMILSYLASFLF
ncbi:hypothetical protein SAMN05421831_10587 [Allopseudospirillum japonicum]|uniref:Uncharacterized protein n=1 Tax=Allopseudospirillum japonicum TaxID=64971 RepID=A0A1H6RXF1_9GAMM|nr:hypothetical protein SAMN05421831_10587 [Allopseudospirillum japonicum]